MMHRKLIAVAAMAWMAAGALHAEPVPGRWEKVEALPRGTPVVVHLHGGERMECVFEEVEADAIRLREAGGHARRFPKKSILKIEGAAADRLRNGTWIGALIGAAGGVLGLVALANAKTSDPVHWAGEDAGGFLAGGLLVGGGIGAAAGALIDASVRNREVLYRSPPG